MLLSGPAERPSELRASAQDAPLQRWAWLPVAGEVALGDLRASAPGETRRDAVVRRMRDATQAGVSTAIDRLRDALTGAGHAGATVEARELLWLDGSAVLRVELPGGTADAARGVDELLRASGARILDPDDLPRAVWSRSLRPDRSEDGHLPGSRASGRDRDDQIAASATSGRSATVGQRQWFDEALGFAAARRSGLTGEGVRVAVVDSGADGSHGELRDALARGRRIDAFADVPVRSGHGTFVAGIVAGASTGLAPGVDLMSARTYGAGFGDHRGEDEASRVTQRANAIRALQESLAPTDGARGADVLVTSWGILDAPGVPATDYDRAMATVAAAGAVVVAAAGNDGARHDGGGTIAVPAQSADVLAAGGVDRGLGWHWRASTGPSPRTGTPKPDVAAPVVDIRSASLGGGIADTTGGADGGFAGTSAAAPIVASLVALLTQAVHDRGFASPDLDEVRSVLPMLARDVDQSGADPRTGVGVVDASRVHEAAAAIVASRTS